MWALVMTADGIEISRDTLPRLLARNAQDHAGEIALREKDRGIWREFTWADYADQVVTCAAGLQRLGIKENDAVVVLGDNRVRLYIGMVATSMLRDYAMPAYPGATLAELQHFVSEAPIAAAFAEDQEQVDKLLDLREAGDGSPARIIYDDPRGLGEYKAPGLMRWEALMEEGARALALPIPACANICSRQQAPRIRPCSCTPPAPRARPRGSS